MASANDKNQTACVIPVPGGGDAPKQVEDIKPGTSTRADVLLRLGDPTVRGKEDSYFVYSWLRSHGGALLAFPYPFALVAGTSCHCLAFRFAADGAVSEVKEFDGEPLVEGVLLNADIPGRDVCSRDRALAQRIEAWLAEPPPARQ